MSRGITDPKSEPSIGDLDDLLRRIRRHTAPLVPREDTIEAFCVTLKTRTYGKGEHLSRAGDVSDTLFFVQTGLLRYYYLLDGVEHTGQFFDEGSFVADVRSLTGNVAALQSIDALEATTVICISGAALQRSFDSDHAMERFGRKVIEEAMAGSQRRSASLLMRSPEQRYADLIQSRPAIVRQVPQYVIASYLAVTPESLSRIRSRRASSRTS